ncbi:DUF7946 domain-containing protein [Halomonas sp. AOP13-D3-9]
MGFEIKTTYEGGMYDEGLSDLYDGSKSLNGFSRAISIVAHVLVNEEVIYKATAMKGIVIYRKASRKGSFVEIFEAYPLATAVASGITANVFYDMLKYSFNIAAGKNAEPETKRVRQLLKRKEPIIGQLHEALEEPLKEMHRPIKKNEEVTIDVGSSRKKLVHFDKHTCEYLFNDVVSDLQEGIVGNVTKYNTLTGYGRMYVDSMSKTYSFKIDEFLSSPEKYLITWSLDEAYDNRGGGKLSLDIRSIETVDGVIKRIIVYKVSKKP